MVSGVIVKLVNCMTVIVNINQELSIGYIRSQSLISVYTDWLAFTIINTKLFSSPICLANRAS